MEDKTSLYRQTFELRKENAELKREVKDYLMHYQKQMIE